MKYNFYLKLVILVGIIIILFGIFGYLKMFVKQRIFPPELTKENALSLLGRECIPSGVAGKYRSCNIEILKEGNRWVVNLTYNGLYDDSVKAERIKAIIEYKEGQWVKSEVSQTQQCWPERGHQDFSPEPCL
jgi:hypothetical protein